MEIVPLLANLGCDIVELGIPFSDPLADGATIQNASFTALHNGVTPRVCFETASEIRNLTAIPLVFMSYYNPVFAYGLERFTDNCVRAGIDGLIIPDLPPEEGSDMEAVTRRRGIDLVYLLAPTSTEERVRMVAAHSRGFIYLVSLAGVTGARRALPEGLEAFVSRVRHVADQPLCVGFGISTADQARQVARWSDGVIVGSRLVQMLEQADWKESVSSFVKDLRDALDRP